MSRGRGGAVTTRGTKTNTVNQHQLKRNAYKSYDWRPRGRDGESKMPAARVPCDAAEILSRRSSPCCGTHLDIHPAGIPSSSYKSFTARSPWSSPRSPRSLHTSKFLCDYRQCDASEKFLSRVSSPHGTHGISSRVSSPHGIRGDSNRCLGSTSPYSRWGPISRSKSPADAICLRHSCMAPGMEPAGIITRNYEYPYPPEMHSIVRLDSYIKHQGVYKGLGQIAKQTFEPRLGDVIIVKVPRKHPKKDPGYVEFFTRKHEGCHFCSGDLLLRVGKFVENNTWRYNKRHKLYQQTDEYRWLLIGMVDNFVNLLPVTNHGINVAHVDQHCRFFFPRRGDMIVHLQPPDRASQLEWFNPKTKICKGDILVRMYLGEPQSHVVSNHKEVVQAAVEIYMYSGKGLGWIFMGRDDCWYKDGFDLLNYATANEDFVCKDARERSYQ